MEFTLFGKQYFVNKVLAVFILVILILGSGTLGFFLKQVYRPLETPVVEENKVISKAVQATITTGPREEEEEIQVYVTGCVYKPGVVTLKKGQLINDAIKMAGGATKEADLENINLAFKLEENVMLRIKPKSKNGSTGSSAPVKSQTSSAGKSSETQKINSGADIIRNSMDTVVGEAEAQNTKSSLLNINTASQTELENLPNVGPATAKAIIEYREKNGGFQKITDIMKITGIKQKTFDKIKDYICIE